MRLYYQTRVILGLREKLSRSDFNNLFISIDGDPREKEFSDQETKKKFNSIRCDESNIPRINFTHNEFNLSRKHRIKAIAGFDNKLIPSFFSFFS